MAILVLNAGSSSLKAAIVDGGSGRHLATAIEREVEDHAAALPKVLATLEREAPEAAASLEAIGHRIVHGGESLRQPVRVDDGVEAAIEACLPLAPLHNPPGLAVLRVMRRARPDLPQVAVFDTAFHATLPEAARRYALPLELCERHGLRRFGFHGISHANVMARCAQTLAQPAQALRIVSCHLGAGGSVAAIDRGRSVDTSMGFTPLEGLVMATRPGDVDAGVLLKLLRDAALAPAELEDLLNRRSGLQALAGTPDMAQVERRAAAGDARCALALDVYVHRLRRYLGAMVAVMDGVDAIAFTGGIGEHSATVRARVCEGLGWLGAQLDPRRNAGAVVTPQDPVATISLSPVSPPAGPPGTTSFRPAPARGGAVTLLVVAADEERAIAAEIARLLA